MDTTKKATYDMAWRRQVEGRFCDCGAPAVGCFQGYFECARCRALETLRASREFRRESAGVAEASVMKPRVFVERFRVAVVERAEEIVVLAHGEYHLNLAATGE